MNIVTKAVHHQITDESRALVEEKLAPVARLLGKDSDTALLEIEIEPAPAEGRSATPTRLVANLAAGGEVFHAEVVKPTPESAADRARSDLEAEIKRVRGRKHELVKRGRAALKRMLRFGRDYPR